MDFGLEIQALTTSADRVLCITALAERLHQPAQCSPREIEQLFVALRVPPPKLSNVLPRLRGDELVMSPGRGTWSLTPRGRKRAAELTGPISDQHLHLAAQVAPSGELADVAQHVIPPLLAPPRWRPGIDRLLAEHPFDTNVFCMTRFPESGTDTTYLDPVKDVIDTAREALSEQGLTLHLASDRVIDDELFGNIAAHMWACRFGLALFEDRMGRGLNYNLVIEVGAMLATGRRCALLKDSTIDRLPTDLVGHIYKDVAFDDQTSIRTVVKDWAVADLGVGSAA